MKDLSTLSYFLGLEVTSSSIFPKLNMLPIFSPKPNKIVSTPLKFNAKLTPLDGEPISDATHYRQLVGSLIYQLSLARIFHMLWVWLVNSWMPLVLFTMLLFFGFSNTSRVHFIIVFTTPLNLLLSSVLIQMQIRQVILLIDASSQVFVFCWILLLSHGVARNRMWFLIPIPRLSIMPLSTPLVRACLASMALSWYGCSTAHCYSSLLW